MINIIFLGYFIRYVPMFYQVENITIYVLGWFAAFQPCKDHTANAAACTMLKDKLRAIERLLIYLRELVYICQMNPFHTGKKTKCMPLPAFRFKIIFVVGRAVRPTITWSHART